MNDPVPSTVLLDALGTLLELQPPAPRLRELCAREFGIEVGLPDAQRAIEAEIAYYRSHLDEGRDPASLAALRRSCAEALRAALPGVGEVDGDALTDVLLASLQFRVFDDVAPALGALRQRQARIVVVSNWDVSLHEVLAMMELSPLLDAVVTSAEVGARKPAREIFTQALESVGAEAETAVHIGDSLTEDVEGARAAGIRAILMRRDGGDGPPAVPVISSLAELWP